MLKLDKISAAYARGHWIIRDVDLELEDGGRIAVLGRNGAGKSTFLKTIMSMVPLRQGKIIYQGKDITGVSLSRLKNAGIGYFAQGAIVLPHLSIDENLRVAMGRRVIRRGLPELEYLKSALPVLQGRKIFIRKAGDLSGGERTQLALAMALVNKPSLLLLDEPFAGISPVIKKMIVDLLEGMYRENPFTMILVAQNQDLASSLVNDTYIIRDRILSAK